MDNMPKVSVIIPVYNVENYIAKCLESVVSQTMSEIEIICVDDGSTDDSLNILKAFEEKDDRITVIAKENGGAGTARNAGLRVAKGEYLSFLDSDDFFEADMLEKAYAECKAKDADICVFRSDAFDDETGGFYPADWTLRREYLPEREPFTCREFKNRAFHAFVGWAWDKLFRREFVEKNGLYYQDLRTTNDMFFVFTALVTAERIITMDHVLAHQRRRTEGSLSVTREKSWNCFLKALDALEGFLKERGEYDEYKRGFLNYALHFSLWNLNSINGGAYMKLYNALRSEYFVKWGIADYSEDYFFSKGEYGQYKRIEEMPFEIYVVDSMNRYRQSYERLRGQIEAMGVKPVDEVSEELRAVKNSASFKIGRAVTYVPRKIARLLGVERG